MVSRFADRTFETLHLPTVAMSYKSGLVTIDEKIVRVFTKDVSECLFEAIVIFYTFLIAIERPAQWILDALLPLNESMSLLDSA